MNADAGGLGVWYQDHIGVLDVFMVCHIQDGDSDLEMVVFDAVPIEQRHIEPTIRIAFWGVQRLV